MALIREVLGKTPIVGEDVFLAETAVIIGDVVMGDACSIERGCEQHQAW